LGLRITLSETEQVMTWKQVTLSNDDIVAYRHGELQDAFEAVFMAHSAPKDAAMFGRIPDHKVYDYYFSPGAVGVFRDVLETWKATDCARPDRDGTSLLVGHADAWDMLPEAKSDGT
jgi:hypothetical protein